MTLLETIRHHLVAVAETLTVAERNLREGQYRSAIHEAYYAMFYAAAAAFGTLETRFKRHSAVISEFNRVFVHERKTFEPGLAAAFEATSEDRMTFDYEPEKAAEVDAQRAVASAREFCAAVGAYVEEWLKTAQDKEP